MGTRKVHRPGIGSPGAQITPLGIQLAAELNGALTIERMASEVMSALRVVRATPQSVLVIARPPEPEALAPLGVSVQSGQVGSSIRVVVQGPIVDSFWSWTPGQPVLLGYDGQLTQSQPANLPFLVSVGIAVTPETLMVNIQAPLRTAA